MKKLILLFVFISSVAYAQKVNWVSSSPENQWKIESTSSIAKNTSNKVDVIVNVDHPQQVIEGFGACFNELGWVSLSYLSAKDRENIMQELFEPNTGANFTICRMPLGANDFSRQWYSYNETEGDFEMKNFSISNDYQTLIPFIKKAQKYNPSLKLWASPWSPPHMDEIQ